jgi:hypothetical protein
MLGSSLSHPEHIAGEKLARGHGTGKPFLPANLDQHADDTIDVIF